jgi:hypothetical protein
VEITGMAAASRGSSSRATSASTAENASRTPSVVISAESSTTSWPIAAGSGSVQNHLEAPLSSRTASIIFLPAERLEAATFTTSKRGWLPSEARNCWPARPVAPTTATGIRDILLLPPGREI